MSPSFFQKGFHWKMEEVTFLLHLHYTLSIYENNNDREVAATKQSFLFSIRSFNPTLDFIFCPKTVGKKLKPQERERQSLREEKAKEKLQPSISVLHSNSRCFSPDRPKEKKSLHSASFHILKHFLFLLYISKLIPCFNSFFSHSLASVSVAILPTTIATVHWTERVIESTVQLLCVSLYLWHFW